MMRFIKNRFAKKLPPLNFKSLLIITYGRSGSTLLQSILNSIDGVVIRGENFGMCYHLFRSYQSLMKSKLQDGLISQSPFYGVELLNEKYYLSQIKETVKTLLTTDPNNNQAIRCYGFKEIRYIQDLANFDEFLEFLQKIFPDVCFIFNTRNKEDVVKSWVSVNLNNIKTEEEMFNILDKSEVAFFDFIEKHKENSFHIEYNDVIEKTERLKALFLFLGAQYVEENITKVLSFRHSYKPNQMDVQKLPYRLKSKKKTK